MTNRACDSFNETQCPSLSVLSSDMTPALWAWSAVAPDCAPAAVQADPFGASFDEYFVLSDGKQDAGRAPAPAALDADALFFEQADQLTFADLGLPEPQPQPQPQPLAQPQLPELLTDIPAVLLEAPPVIQRRPRIQRAPKTVTPESRKNDPKYKRRREGNTEAARKCRAREKQRAEHFKALLPVLVAEHQCLAAERADLLAERTRLLLQVTRRL